VFIFEVFRQSVQVALLVFLMMVIVDLIDVRSQGRLRRFVQSSQPRQYITTSLLGVTPGCLGAFMNVTLYIHGFLTFGAIVGGMVATSGDEAFVMLAQFPQQALLLFAILFLIAIPVGWIADIIAKVFHIIPCKGCELHEIHADEKSPGHYVIEHVWKHILKQHIWRVFLWTFFALLFIRVGLTNWHLADFLKGHMGLILVLSVLVGIIPESGPHFVFVMMFANGLIPFSVLLASSIAQDGHGMLPLLSYTIRDTLLVKAFNIGIALLVGGGAYCMGW
jgi:hypothetical protein